LPRAAVGETVRVAVMDVSLATLTLLTVIPDWSTCTVGELAAKFVPVIVTFVVPPLTPLEGEMDVMVGVDEVTANCTILLPPPFGVDTKTKYFPMSAVGLMLNVAVNEVSL
jgi:hypothetical protein